MNTNTQEQFSQDIDTILHNTRPSRSEIRSGRDLEIAKALAAADFSPESRVRRSLRSRLLDQAAGIEKTMIFPKRLARFTAVLLVTAILVLAASPLGTTLARSLVRIVQDWQVGENTLAVSVDGDFEAVPGENGETVILPVEPPSELPAADSPGLFEDPDGERHLVLDPTVSFEKAQEMLKFDLKMPAYVPEGYSLNGVVVIRSGQASVEFVNLQESRLLGLLQTAVGGADGKVQVSFTSDMLVVDTEVGGRAALWTQSGDEGMLIWEADGVNYQLMGASDLETALRIAESLQ